MTANRPPGDTTAFPDTVEADHPDPTPVPPGTRAVITGLVGALTRNRCTTSSLAGDSQPYKKPSGVRPSTPAGFAPLSGAANRAAAGATRPSVTDHT
ncbi:hypothetical protein GCM10027599_24060 [Yimella radicis]